MGRQEQAGVAGGELEEARGSLYPKCQTPCAVSSSVLGWPVPPAGENAHSQPHRGQGPVQADVGKAMAMLG